MVREPAQANSKSWIEYNKKWSAFASVREGGVDAERRINQKGQRKKTMKAKKMVWYLRRILFISKAKKSSKSLRLEAQSMIFMQGVIIKHLMRQILVADRPHS